MKLSIVDGAEKEISGLQNCDYEKLAQMLNSVLQSEETNDEVSQVTTLSEMNSEVKLSYLKIIINLTLSDDGEVDPKEYAELLSLIVKLEFSSEERVQMRSYINNPDNIESNKMLIENINSMCPAGNGKSLHVSLVKDILNVFKSTKNGNSSDCIFLIENKELFNVTDEEIELAEMAINNDRALIEKEVTNDQIKKNMSELAAKAGAVGVPIAAVYMSGSVVGLSAAGITSGLASMGLGGVLGFSGMVSGIGIAVLLGLGAYKGVKKLTGSKEVEQQKKREFLLQEVIKHTQATINILVNDFNYISSKLTMAIQEGLENKLQIEKLSKEIAILSKTGAVLTQKTESTKIEALKTKCPNRLDVEKLKTLTNEPTKKKYYDAVLTCYEKIEEDSPEVQYQLKKQLPVKQVSQLVDILEALGYFSIKGTTQDLVNKGKEKIKGFFK